MGMKRKGFTLIELLIVIVIISLLAALLLPALLKALCNARAGTASALINQLSQASKSYELDYAVYPPGKGKDSKDLAYYLQKKGAKQMPYFEFPLDLLPVETQGSIVNPVWGKDGTPPSNMIYYRNNPSMKPPGSSAPPVAPSDQCPVIHPNSIDLWCAGCDWREGDAPTAPSNWSIKYE